MRTKGQWEIIGITNIRSKKTHEHIVQCFDKDDLKFIAMCGTVANQLDSQGINGEEAIRRLPEMIEALKASVFWNSLDIKKIFDQLKQTERKEGE